MEGAVVMDEQGWEVKLLSMRFVGADVTRNTAKLKEGQTSESSSARALSFAYGRTFCNSGISLENIALLFCNLQLKMLSQWQAFCMESEGKQWQQSEILCFGNKTGAVQ